MTSTHRRNPTPQHPADRPADPDQPTLTPMQREQLTRDLHDLPELCDHMHANYWWFVGRGSRDPDDRSVAYVIDPAPVDLYDWRLKGRGVHADPIGEADLAMRIGAQRAGVLPLLAGWVDLIAGEMRDQHAHHTAPAIPHTVTSAAGWITRHLDWISTQPYTYELRHQVRDLVVNLERLVGPAYAAPDTRTLQTADQLAQLLGIEPDTIRQWKSRGLIEPAVDPRTGEIMRAGRQPLYYTREAKAVHTTRKGRKPR